MAVTPRICVQAEDFDLAAEVSALTAGRADIGAVVTFSGLCRDEQGTLSALEIERYPGMAERAIGDIARQAAERWPILGMTIIHRFGRLMPGENIVLVAVASSHRGAAFEAASFMMDYLKSAAPFWKKAHHRDGTTSAWVEAKDTDDRALDRWNA